MSDSDALLAEEDRKQNSYGAMKSKPIPIKTPSHDQRDSGLSVESNVAIDDDDLPDPSDDKFLNSLFRYAALREDQVQQLAIELNVDRHIRLEIPKQGNTVLQAVEVCRQWRNLHPEDCEDKRTACTKLKTALENCGLSRPAYKRLLTKMRTKSALGLDNKNVLQRLECVKTDDQVYTFAHHLGLKTSEIETTMSYSYTSRASCKMKAFRIFEEWKANQPDDDTVLEVLEQALAAVEKDNPEIEITREVERRPEVVVTTVENIVEPPVIAFEGEDLPTTTPEPNNQQQQDPPTTIVTTDNKQKGVAFNRKSLCCYGLLAVLIALILLLVTTAFTVPSYKHDISLILSGDTVRVLLPYWRPPEIDIQLNGQIDGCDGKITVTEDRYIQTSVNTLEDPSRNYTYLPKGSNVTISPKDVTGTGKYNIWLFSSYRLAEEAVESRFPQDTFSCSHPPKGAQCDRIDPGSKPLVFHVHETSYYFLRCDDIFVNCTFLNHWTYHQVVYNYNEAEIHSISNTTIQSQKGHVTLHLRRPFFPPLRKTKKATLLVQLDPASCGSHDNKYFLSVTYITLYQEIAVYLAVGTVSMAILGGAFVIGRLFGCKCCKKRENAETDPLLEANT